MTFPKFLLKFIFYSTIVHTFSFKTVHSECTSSEEVIYSYDNSGGTSPATVSFETMVGGSQTRGTSETSSSGKDSTSGYEVSAQVRAWILEASGRKSASDTERNDNSTTSSVEELLTKETKYTTAMEVKPGVNVKVFQEFWHCGDVTVRTSNIRREDVKSTNKKHEFDLASQQLQLNFDLEIGKLKHGDVIDARDKAHKIDMKTKEHNELMEHRSHLRTLLEKSSDFIGTIHNRTMSLFKVSLIHNSEIENKMLEHAQKMERETVVHAREKENKTLTSVVDFMNTHGLVVWLTSTFILISIFVTCCVFILRKRKYKRPERKENYMLSNNHPPPYSTDEEVNAYKIPTD